MPALIRIDKPLYTKGNLWDFHKQGYWVVVTTNIGWKSNGENVMGAGVAKQAAARFPEFPRWYGELCKSYKESVGICFYNQGSLIAFPTKPLNKAQPHLSWQGNSSLQLIEQWLPELRIAVEDDHIKKVAMSYPGCGNGGLQPKQVKPLLDKYLTSRFTVVEYNS